jgi:hypothetical protein
MTIYLGIKYSHGNRVLLAQYLSVRRLGQQNQKSITSFIVVQFRNIQLIIRYDNRTAQVSLNFE